MSTPYDFSKCKVGDVLALLRSRSLSEQVIVVKRTPKYLHLDNGDRLHVETTTGKSEKWNRYEPWSAEREAERAEEVRQDALRSRYRSLMPQHCHATCSVSRQRVYLTESAVVSNADAFHEYLALIQQQEQDRYAAIVKVLSEDGK